MPTNVPVISLAQLHKIVTDIWLKRHDEDLRVERESRRAGRPRSAKEDKLLELQLQDREEFRSGLGWSLLFVSPAGITDNHLPS
jgi:hypothetical protein